MAVEFWDLVAAEPDRMDCTAGRRDLSLVKVAVTVAAIVAVVAVAAVVAAT